MTKVLQENEELKNRLMDLSEQLFLQDLSDNMESCILDKSVSMIKSISNFQGRNKRNFENNNRLASENELPVFDKNGVDFTKGLTSRTAQTSIRNMRYSQRNNGYYPRGRDYGDFQNRFAQDPNQNVFMSGNSHKMDRFKFIGKKRDGSRPRNNNDVILPVKRKNNKARSRTPKKLSKIKKDSDSESLKNKKLKNIEKSKVINFLFIYRISSIDFE